MLGAFVGFLVGLSSVQDAQARAAEIVGRLDSLKAEDYEALREIGDPAFKLIYPIVEARIFRARSDNREWKYPLDRALSALERCARPEHTGQMIALTKLGEPGLVNRLYDWLANEGDAKLARQTFVQGLARHGEAGQYSPYSACVMGLVRIGDRGAVRVLLGHLKDSEEDPDVRSVILRNVCRTRHRDALEAVRAVLEAGREAPPISRDVKVSRSMSDVEFPVVRTVDGVEWALFTWDGLGSNEDLWIARRIEGKLVAPVFTGMSAHWPRWYPTGGLTEGGESFEAKLKVLADTEWIERFVKNETLRADTDGDGYTDLAEKWLGLDPSLADTDGDGLADGKDKNPHTPRRDLNEEEAALRVAAESLVAFRTTGRNLIVTFPESVQPVELQMHDGVVLLGSSSVREKMTRPDAVAGLRFQFKSVTVAGDEAMVEYEESGGYYMIAGRAYLLKVEGQWYPVSQKVVFSAIA